MKSFVVGAVLLGTVGLAAGTGPAAALHPAPAEGATPVVVQTAGDRAAAARAVRSLGGEVVHDLPIVDGLSARVPASALPELARTPGVTAVTPDRRMTVQSTVDTTGTTAGSDLKSVYADEVGAPALRQRAAASPGTLPRIALVDTGVTPGTDLAGRIVPVEDPTQGELALGERVVSSCANFSGEPTCDDSYGHGTFLAGLMAGDGTASRGRWTGIAPRAEIVSVKIAGRDGSADVSKVLAAIQWVVIHRKTYGIGVLNLSLGTDSTASVETDPLNHAVQRAWEAGIVVVVAASNRGPVRETISKPADDPLVLTVGAVDDRETPALSDDRSPAFTGRGPTAHKRAKPDVVAPGVRLVSLRSRLPDGPDDDTLPDPSFIDERSPGGVDAVHRRGSGTSQATAVVSGVVALLRQAQPGWTPDDVKRALKRTAEKVNTTDPTLVGAGLVQGDDAAAATRVEIPGTARTATGTGSLDQSRGTVEVQRDECLVRPCAVEDGETTAQGGRYDAAAYTSDASWTDRSDSSGSSWYDTQWVTPYGSSWYGSSWYGSSWYGSSWYGVEGDDQAARPFGLPVPGSAWYGVYQ